jgi:hypothetical protein
MDDSLTKRELELFGRLDATLQGVNVDVEDGSVGKLHFRVEDAEVSVDRTEVAAAAESLDELSKDIELRLLRGRKEK